VVGAGPAGLAAAAEAAQGGHDVLLLERGERIGGQLALAGAAPGHAEMARSLQQNYERLLARGGVEITCGLDADEAAVVALEPDGVVAATGARPYRPDLPLEGVEVIQAWDVLAGPRPRGRRVVVADWGGDAAGLDASELLDAAGNAVVLAVGSASFGEAVHQYQRNLYAQRLYRAGVRIEHHLDLTGASGGRVVFQNLFAPELETSFEADILVLALGRVPERGLAERLRGRGLLVEEAGDSLGPRTAEEATLEGTLAARRVLQGAAVGSPSA
jgi:pyruvate/2-oxoglutarate dehydrogenase complex dihydrolipoamide dehydrogenase (E3) component